MIVVIKVIIEHHIHLVFGEGGYLSHLHFHRLPKGLNKDVISGPMRPGHGMEDSIFF